MFREVIGVLTDGGGNMFLGDPGEGFYVSVDAILSWVNAAPFFLLMCVFRVLFRVCKYKRLMALNAIWASMISFIISVLPVWQIIRYVSKVVEKQIWGGNFHILFGYIVLLIIGVLIPLISLVICVISFRDIWRLWTSPQGRGNINSSPPKSKS